MNRFLVVSLAALFLVPSSASAQGDEDLDLSNPYGVEAEENPFSRGEPSVEEAPIAEAPIAEAPPEATPDEEAGEAGEEEADGAAEDDEDGPVREHGIGFGMHMTHLVSSGDELEEGKTFNMAGPSVQYTFFRGYRFGYLMNIEFFFPLTGTQNVDAAECSEDGRCNLRKLYDQTLGYDLSFMMAYHEEPIENLSINAGVGLHCNIIELSDNSLRDFNNISLGIASMATLRYNIHSIVSIGGNATFAVDWADMIHEQGKLQYAFNYSLSFVVGVHL